MRKVVIRRPGGFGNIELVGYTAAKSVFITVIGDVLIALDGNKIQSPWDLASALQGKVDVDVKIELIRAGQKQTVSIHV